MTCKGLTIRRGNDCDNTVSRVNTLIDIHATHSDMKSLSLSQRVNTLIETNVAYYLCQLQSKSLAHHVNGP